MSIRLLEELDYYKGFINLLKQLTTTDDISYNNFLDIFNSLQISTPIYEIKTYVIEDEKSDDGFCSFKCWENVLCQNPQEEISEEFVLDLS